MTDEDKELLIRTFNQALVDLDVTRCSMRRAGVSLDRLAELLRRHKILDPSDPKEPPK